MAASARPAGGLGGASGSADRHDLRPLEIAAEAVRSPLLRDGLALRLADLKRSRRTPRRIRTLTVDDLPELATPPRSRGRRIGFQTA